jgi:L-threonylcarbamoyladenylate synthase
MELKNYERIECVSNDIPESKMKDVLESLKNGELIVYPTETLYGLGANALDEAAVKKVYMVKRRPFDMPISVAVSDLEMLDGIAVLDDRARTLVRRLMPGPLTLLLTKKPIVPDILTSATMEVGVRIPDHPFALKLIRMFGPITSTSANVHSRPDPMSASEVMTELRDLVRFYLDCGKPMLGKPSTIVQLTDQGFEIIRSGAIPKERIEAALNE